MFHIVGSCETQSDLNSFLDAASVVYGEDCSVTIIISQSLAASTSPSENAHRRFVVPEENEPWLSTIHRTVDENDWLWIFHPRARPSVGARSAAEFWLRVHPEARLLYGDTMETSIGRRISRPRFSPIRMLSTGDIGSSLLLHSSVLEIIPIPDTNDSFDAQWYRFAVAAAHCTSYHVPVVFDEFCMPDTVAIDGDGRKNALLCQDSNLRVTGFSRGNLIIGGQIGDATVSVIIPSVGASADFPDGRQPALLVCLTSLVRTAWDRIHEVIVVTGPRMSKEILADAAAIVGDRLRVIHVMDPFSFSASCNAGAVNATGSHILFLNDDVEATEDGWLEQMLSVSMLPNVGCVGARLMFPDGTIQHAGIVLDARKLEPNHVYMHLEASQVNDPIVSACSEFSAVTGACLLISSEDFMRIGGFSPDLPLNYNDVDLCLKSATTGKSTVCCNSTRLIHRESTTRVPTVTNEEMIFISAWSNWFLADPFVNMWG